MTITNDDTTETFEARVVTPLRIATARMNHAKKIMPEVKEILTEFHRKVIYSIRF